MATQNIKKLLHDLDTHNENVKKSLRRNFFNKVEANIKDNFKQFVGIKTFGYSRQFADNYDKIDWGH